MTSVFKHIDSSAIPEAKSINLLIIGETGVGKSTFINAIVNYLNFDSLDQAAEKKPFIFIPTKFTITDENYEEKIIKIGSDVNEHDILGQSSTQDPRTYTFPLNGGEKYVNLIDTPGIGDTRGIDQDTLNCEKILNYIAPLKYLHGICFLVKPNNSKINILFEFCMKQILSRLEKSASNNLIFVFTGSRETNYRPGETLPCLRNVLADIKRRPPYVDIPLTKRNMYCFDNEGLRYLFALENGVKFHEYEKIHPNESWIKSTEEAWRMIRYLIGDGEVKPLEPHRVESTISVNDARNVINQLKRPMADITQLIQDKLRVLQRHQQLLQLNTISIHDLKKNLFVPIIDIETMELTKPVTVCTSYKCAEMYKVRNLQKWNYKTRCHNPCYLNNVPREIIGTPELASCAAMDVNKKCKVCGCDFSTHMHIYYESKTVDKTIEDDKVKEDINTKEKVQIEKEKIIQDLKNIQTELEGEHTTIIQYTAKFASFLQQNSITPYNDVYKTYIEYLIDRELKLGDTADQKTIAYLRKLQDEYEEAKVAIDRALIYGDSHKGLEKITSPREIKTSVENLFKLKHIGNRIEDLYYKQQRNRTVEIRAQAVVLELEQIMRRRDGVKPWHTRVWPLKTPETDSIQVMVPSAQ